MCLNFVKLEKWNETQEIKKQGGILGIAGMGAKAEES